MSVTTHPAAVRSTFMPVMAAMAAGTLLFGLLFLPECRAAVGVWLVSTAYGHCFLVLPMAAYLVWDRRDSLRGLQPRPTLGFAVLAVPAAAAWFAAERLGIMEGRQLAALAGLEILFLALLGRRMFLALSGPLLFLVFLVPFGAFITPALQSFTAGFIAVGLHLLGIPAYVTDLTIEISAGSFYVAEACAGLRFLVAAVAFGMFYALLNYHSPGRRVAFIAASIVVPILANGVRALGIVVLGNVLGSAEAAVADHIIYGWGFFSVVMLLLVAAGMPWRQPPLAAPPSQPLQVLPAFPLWPALAVIGICAAGPAAAALLNQRSAPSRIAAILALASPPGCMPGKALSAVDGQVRTEYRCEDGRNLIVTIVVLPYLAPPDQLQHERTRLAISPGAEDTAVSPLRSASPASGRWSVYENRDPDLIVGVSAWVNGAPAEGGLAGRMRLAWDSLHGSSHLPLLMAVAPSLIGHSTAADRQRAKDLIGTFVNAQQDLTSAVADATKIAGN
ncbi:MAG TPA: exosortase A [Acetobacteraceae bacterium]